MKCNTCVLPKKKRKKKDEYVYATSNIFVNPLDLH